MINFTYIEGQTPLNDEEKIGLIPTILNRTDLDALEQENIIEARKWVMQKSILARIDMFNERSLCDLHKRMYRYVWKWAGTFRKTNKNIGVEFFWIQTELKKLVEDAKFWLGNNTFPIEEIAVRFHHRLVKIHLFPNGNGRHARLCADIIVAKYNASKLSWGGNSVLAIEDDIRRKYISALREADTENYEALISFAKS